MLSKKEVKQLKNLVDWHDQRIPPLFQALSDPNRCRIVRTLIKTGKKIFSVSDMAQLLDVSIPTASEHLRILERVGVLKRKRLKQKISYEVVTDDPLIRSIIAVIKANEEG